MEYAGVYTAMTLISRTEFKSDVQGGRAEQWLGSRTDEVIGAEFY